MAATSATLTGPTLGVAGVDSVPFTVTLDAVNAGVTTVALTAAAGVVYHDLLGNVITSIAIPIGALSGQFKVLVAAASTVSIAITSAGLTVPGSPISYKALVAVAAPMGRRFSDGGTLTLGTPAPGSIFVPGQERVYKLPVTTAGNVTITVQLTKSSAAARDVGAFVLDATGKILAHTVLPVVQGTNYPAVTVNLPVGLYTIIVMHRSPRGMSRFNLLAA